MLRSCVAALVVATACMSSALADDVAAAKMHYERGTTLFDLQRYLEAAKEYEAAFEAKPDPALLFNIAQAYRFGGDYTKAVAAYRSYLRRVPDAPNRSEIERRISDLQKLIDAQKHAEQTPPAGTIVPGDKPPQTAASQPIEAPPQTQHSAEPQPPPLAARPPERQSKTKLLTGIIVASVGIVAIGIGAGLEGLASSTNNSLSHPAPGTTFDPSKEQSLKTDEAAGAAMLGIGGAALVSGAVVALLGAHERHHHVAVLPAISTSYVGVAIHAGY